MKKLRYFVYRPEGLSCRPDALAPIHDWRTDVHVRTLVALAVDLLGGAKAPSLVARLPILAPEPGCTTCHTALVLYADGPMAIVSPIRLPAFRRFLAWSLTMEPSKAAYEGFAGRVADEARGVARDIEESIASPWHAVVN